MTLKCVLIILTNKKSTRKASPLLNQNLGPIVDIQISGVKYRPKHSIINAFFFKSMLQEIELNF